MPGRILFVDDEQNILKSLLRLFLDTDYMVEAAESGEEALGKMREKSYDLVVSDMRMPSMDGFQFLHKVKELYPLTFRIILSGYSDESVIMKALQHNVAKLYIFKPWDNEKLIELINKIMQTRHVLGNSQLLAQINNMPELPTIQQSYQRIISLIEQDADMVYISTEIEKDQSMVSKILHIANSAYYGVKTGSIRQAITYLGLYNVKNLVLSTSILESMAHKIPVNKRVESFWSHSFITNKILNFIFEKCLGRKLGDINRSAGLLHNIGIILFLQCHQGKYLSLIENAARSGRNVLEVEIETYMFSHQEAGGYLLNWWELPYSVVEAALYHHHPMDPKIINKELVYAVHLAGKYAWNMLTSLKYSWSFHEEVFGLLNIDKGKFEEQLKLCRFIEDWR